MGTGATHRSLTAISPAVAERRTFMLRLQRCQRRARQVAFIRTWCVAASVVLAALTPALLFLHVDPAATVLWTAGALGVAGVVSGALAWHRGMTLSATATAIDQRLSARDRISAALQVIDTDDDVAPLIVRDASARLRRADPSNLFPLDARRHAGALLAGVVVLAVAVVIARRPDDRADTTQPGRGGLLLGPSAGSPGAENDPAASQASSKDAATEPGTSAGRTDQTAAPGLSSAPPQPIGRRASDESGDVASSAAEAGPGRESTLPSDTAGPAAGSRATSPRDTLGAAQHVGGTGSAASSTASDALASGGAAVAGRGGAGSGGVGAGPLSETPSDASAVPGLPRLPASRVHAAQQAQRALIDDDIPPGRRAYVRDYFRAIVTGSRP